MKQVLNFISGHCRQTIMRGLAVGLLMVWSLLAGGERAIAEVGAGTQWSGVAKMLQEGDAPQTRHLSRKERVVLQAALALKQQQPAQALQLLGKASKSDPLASVIEAEAYRRQALSALQAAGAYAHGVERERSQLASVRLNPWLREANVKLEQLKDTLTDRLQEPVDLLQVGDDIANVFMVDKQRSRLFVFAKDKQGNLRKVADEYVVTGSEPGDKQVEGDGRTPTGIYRFVQRLEGKSLELRYGPVAFPIDYPNVWDRMHHKNGHGIWLHGYAPEVDRRPPRDTKGCFSLSNELLVQLAPKIVLGKSWVVVGNQLRFDDHQSRLRLRDSVVKAIEAWRSDWSSLNTRRYLRHYHPAFRSGKYNLTTWKRHKQYVNSHKRSIAVKISGLTMIHDPNPRSEGEVVVAQFHQHYRSDNYMDDTVKRLYLVRADARHPWRILSEETIDTHP